MAEIHPEPTPRKRSWFDRHPKVTVCAIVVVFYLCVDCVAGLFLCEKTVIVFHPYYRHGFATNTKAIDQFGDVKYVLHTNSLGLKDRACRRVRLKADTYRIVVMGDSFVEGIGFPHEKTFVGLVEAGLRRGEAEMLNAGVRAYSPRLYYLRLKHLLEVEGLAFDKLYLYIDISDIQDEVIYRDFEPRKRRLAKQAGLFVKRHLYLSNGIKRMACHLKESLCARDFEAAGDGRTLDPQFSRRSDRWPDDEAELSEWGQEGLALAAQNVERIASLCRRHRIDLSIAVYPWQRQIRKGDLACAQVTFWRALASEHGLGFLDYFPDFIGETDAEAVIERRFITNDVHWNEEGHALVAARLRDDIAKCLSRTQERVPGT